MADAVVTDPCIWSPEMPHVYDVDVVARIGDQIVAVHHEKIGLRRLAPRRPVDLAPGTG
jgi:beta-galactosidase/beta-glucuronidase